ncbi:MAG: hypothetical protein HWN81_10965 [Candidatus Lokiarchaeota archaeon]|nr:hypothetical protein [Candidatus Lokiarchaeota archaeon]
MDPLNVVKITAAIVSVIIAFTAGFIELRLNPDYWLNRWFTIFFISTSLGFLTYTIYHLILDFSQIIIPIMILAQIFFNLVPISAVMTVFILEKYKKIAMDFRHLGIMMGLFIIMSIGYFIWIPQLNMVSYNQGIVNTVTPIGWFLFVNIIRLILDIFVVYRYAVILRKIEGETKKRIIWFFIGILVAIIGVFFNLIGGFLDFIYLEIVALILLDVGMIIIVKGFFI